jgi:hypothetical protein
MFIVHDSPPAGNGSAQAVPPDLLAVAKNFAPYWREGNRQTLAQCLAGGLARNGWPIERITDFIGRVAEQAGDGELPKREAAVVDTLKRLAGGGRVTGFPTLARALGANGDQLVNKLRNDLGLRKVITLTELAEHKGFPIEFLESLGLQDLPGSEGVGIPYRDAGGKVVAVKQRTDLRAGVGSYWPKGKPLTAYGEDRIDAAVAAGYLLLVEGESDAWTCWWYGLPGLGLPGSGTVKKTLELGHVGTLTRVYALQEPDEGGTRFVAAVRERLATLGWEGQLLVVKLAGGVKDLNELHRQDPGRFKEIFEQALDHAQPLAGVRAFCVCLADVQVQPVAWLWQQLIPRGMITLLDGDPDQGKSLLLCDLAARISRGWKMPPGSGEGGGPPGNVLILNAEDDPARTITPRHVAAGADVAQIHFLSEILDVEGTRPPVLPEDLDLIERLITEKAAVLVVIDPLMAFLSGKVDSHKDSDIRRVLHRLKSLAERTQAAVLIVRHLNKLVSVAEPVYRGGGSIGIIGAARSALLVGRHPDEPKWRVMCRSKGNLAPPPKALAYTIEPYEGCARVGWLGEVDLSAKDLLSRKPEKRGAKGEAGEAAVAFLQEILAGGPVAVNVINEQAEDRFIDETTLNRAKRKMVVQSFKRGFPGQWFWRLPGNGPGPEDPAEDGPPEDGPPEDGQVPDIPGNLTTFGENNGNSEVSSKMVMSPSDHLRPDHGNSEVSPEDGQISGEPRTFDHLRSDHGNSVVSPEDGQITEGLGELDHLRVESLPSASAAIRAVCGGEDISRVLVRSPAGLVAVLAALDETEVIGLDLETSGLNPRDDRVRLVSLATDRGTWLIDAFEVGPRPLFDSLAERTVVGHNLLFDLAFLAPLGFKPVKVRDTMLLSQLLHAGQRYKHRLEDCSDRELSYRPDKTLQKSDWKGKFTSGQLDYAAGDAEVLRPLCRALETKIKAAGLQRAADIEMRCLPAVVWLSLSGATLDRGAWTELAQQAEAEVLEIAGRLDALAPERTGHLDGYSGWNWDSPQQVREALAAAGCEVTSTRDEALAAVNHPLADLIRKHRAASKRASTYGIEWLGHVAGDGRVYAGWRQIGAASGRMSCSAPNLQQLPRGQHRRCIVAPPGRVLVKAD